MSMKIEKNGKVAVTDGHVTHTPGPWKVLPEECDRPYIRIRGTALGGRYRIANVLTPTYEGVDSREAEETRCNANLIASSPELLAALQMLYDETADYIMRNPSYLGGMDNPCMRQAREALVRASGGEK
jgi:hypothetical protein